jgi:hypothetical protein
MKGTNHQPWLAQKWHYSFVAGALAIVCASCTKVVQVSPVFEGADLEQILIGSRKPGEVPELRSTAVLQPEYNFKDCELVLTVPQNQTINTIMRIMSDCTNSIVRLGGRILSNTNINQWASHELTYETARTTGLFRLYSAEVGDSKMKLVAVMIEAQRER